jgi:hypothetical protein
MRSKDEMMDELATTSSSVMNTQNRVGGGVPVLTYSQVKMTSGAVSSQTLPVVALMLGS